MRFGHLADVPLTVAGRWLDPVSGVISRPPKALKPTQSGFLLVGAEAEGEPTPYSADLFAPPMTWAELLREDERYPEDVAFAPAPLGCGEMMLSYPDWFRKGMGARPTPRKWFATWRYPKDKEAPATEAGLAAFRDARFGMFIHWGLYSLLGGRWKGQTMDYIGEWIQSRYRIPSAEYAQLAERFNPTEFDADAWAKSAADAGMSYVVLTTKHHEGFALFASKASPFNVVDATPFARDVFAELAAACNISPSRLSHLFSSELGTTPVKLRTSIRIEKAAELLRSTDKSVALIGQECGWASPIYFSKVFGSVVGVTPGEYRAASAKGR